jgi:hypothetical protein
MKCNKRGDGVIEFLQRPSTAFEGARRIADGPLGEVALAVKAATKRNPEGAFLTFEDATGRVIDLDLRGSDKQVIERLAMRAEAGGAEKSAQRRGRPKLGVVAREVTLLPRQWDWLAAQPGGASQTLRRLVDAARSTDQGKVSARAAQEAAYHFMHAMAGDRPGYEEALRALFAGDYDRLVTLTAGWPVDVRDYALRLARREPG